MTTLPESLKSEREKNADKLAFAGDSVPSEECYRRGWDDLFQLLLESGEVFDQIACAKEGLYEKRIGVDIDSAYIRGARSQHQILTAQYQAKLAAKDAEIEQLKEYKFMYEELSK